jgi:cobalamin transport system substrate-binding protein
MNIKRIVLILMLLFDWRFASAATDMMGREVSLKAAPNRIVSLAPSCTEIIAVLGLQKKLVGITEHTDYPPEVLDLPKVGSYVNLNVELILSLRPDLVIATDDGNPEEVIEKLDEFSVPVFVLNLRTYEDIENSVRKLGDFLGNAPNAEAAVRQMRSVASCISDKTKHVERPSVLWIYDMNPIVSAGNDTFTNELIQMAGGASMTGDVSISYPRVAIESVIAKNPQIIVITTMDPFGDGNEKRQWWNQWTMIRAVQNKRVYLMDSKNLDRPSPRIVYGFMQLARVLHPEIFPDDACLSNQQ